VLRNILENDKRKTHARQLVVYEKNVHPDPRKILIVFSYKATDHEPRYLNDNQLLE